MKILLIFILCAFFWAPYSVRAQAISQAEMTYNAAVKALDQDDCDAGVRLLEKFKLEAESFLRKNADIARKIEMQIAECKSSVKGSMRIRGDLPRTLVDIPAESVAQGGGEGSAATGGISGASAVSILLIILFLLIAL